MRTPDMRLLRRLADGAWHDADALAGELGVHRRTIREHVDALDAWQLEVESAPGTGHRLARPLDLLDAARIRAALSAAANERYRQIDVLPVVVSTNDVLLAAGSAGERLVAALAEYQSRGRGRRGRDWVSPFGAGLCLSVGVRFDRLGDAGPALSLAVGVIVLRALASLGITGVQLKWPNDMVFDGRKLGGILVQVRAEAGAAGFAVIGVGLNVNLAPEFANQFDDSALVPVDLAALDASIVSRRNMLAAALLDQLAADLPVFAQDGLVGFVAEWSAADALAGRQITVTGTDGTWQGEARGIDSDGALKVWQGQQTRRIISADVTVRRASPQPGRTESKP